MRNGTAYWNPEEGDPETMDAYAFWRYDLPPYIIGAKVKIANVDGTVIPVGFQGRRVRPAKILLGKHGEDAMLEVRRLSGEYNTELRDLHLKYRRLGEEALCINST